MEKRKRRNSFKNRGNGSEVVFFLDGRNAVNKPRVISGKVTNFDIENNQFTVTLHSGVKMTFSIADWDEIVFGSREKAQAMANKLPKVGMVAYLLDEDKKKITFEVVAYYSIPYVYFKNGASALVSEFNKTFFAQATMAITRLEKIKKED